MKSTLLDEVYNCFFRGAFEESVKVLEKALSVDYEDERIICALKCANFWTGREQRLSSVNEDFAKGEFLLKEWKNFSSFFNGFRENDERCLNSIRQWCFSTAVESYERIFYDSGGNDFEIIFRIGRCYKCMGDYASAISFLERTYRQQKENAAVIAELADCYALINEVKAAKLFFREAFYLEPCVIEPAFLESMMISRLFEKVAAEGYAGGLLLEWLPVYGVIYGIFNVKRELKPLELGKLKQAIFSYENRINEKADIGQETEPRLLNSYFRLIDHYICTGAAREKTEDILRKIKRLNNHVFEQYIN